MPSRRALPSLVVVALTLAALPAWGKKAVPAPHYLTADGLDWKTLLEPGPPAPDSPEAKAEVATDLHWQEVRTPDDVARCKREDPLPPWTFAEVLGARFTHKSCPLTDKLLRRAEVDALFFADSAKEKWERARPPAVDSRIHPCVGKQLTGSYPSSHAARGMLWGDILAELYPTKAEQLKAVGKRIGDDRVIAGIHFPSDVAAGQKLGDALAQQLLANPAFKADLEQARAETAAVLAGPTTR